MHGGWSAVLLAEVNADLGVCVCGLGSEGLGAGGVEPPIGLDLAWRVQVVNAVIRIETSSPGRSTPSLAT